MTEEERAIRSLKKIARNWPSTLWLFSANGNLHVMRKAANGDCARLRNGAMDPAYILAVVDIQNDGGDW